MLEEAARNGRPPDVQAICLILMDIKKAYPNAPRKLCWAVLAKLGVPEPMLRILQGLHETTRYVVRTKAGDSQPYTLARGLREGCPSSCVIYNIFHNVCLKKIMTHPHVNGITYTSDASRLLCRGVPTGPDVRQITTKVAGFADDTSAPTRMTEYQQVETAIISTMASFGEHVHPGKTERLRAGPWDQVLPDGFMRAVRLLGAWLDCDGGGRTDTEKRLCAARLVWKKVFRQLPRLDLSMRVSGRVVESTVIACLLYGSEVRCFTAEEVRSYQVFVNRIVRHITWRPGAGGMRWMEGRATMADLWAMAGLKPISEYILEKHLR